MVQEHQEQIDDTVINEDGRVQSHQQQIEVRDPLSCYKFGDKLDTNKLSESLLLGFANVNGLRRKKWQEKNVQI